MKGETLPAFQTLIYCPEAAVQVRCDAVDSDFLPRQIGVDVQQSLDKAGQFPTPLS